MTDKSKKSGISRRMGEALNAMNRAGQGNSPKANKLRETKAQLDAAPDSIVRDKGFLNATWAFMKNLFRWAWTVFTGSLRWVCNVIQSALNFVGSCLNGLATCGEEFVDDCDEDSGYAQESAA